MAEPRTNSTQKEAAKQKVLREAKKVIYALSGPFENYNNIITDLDRAQANFFDSVKNNELQIGFDIELFAPYHPFLFHETTKTRFVNIFLSFLSDCIHRTYEVMPIEVIRYNAFKSSLEYALTALDEIKIEKRKPYTDFNNKLIPLTSADLAMNALCDFQYYTNSLFKEHNEVIKRYEQSKKISAFKADFYEKIENLAQVYQIPLKGAEFRDKILGGKIVEFYGIKDTKTE
ncbi:MULTISPECIES: hypothetical protein [unclassified Campylobacter]|uniref:hypothetical protein n=1 Tax=unclassified Campylobacter TaxID=2593542 RepID=UPI003D325E3B